MVRLTGYQDRYPAQLSGGQQQRVALARTLITGPELLLLDEPFAALDTHVKQHLMEELLDIVKRKFVGTVLLVTHNIEEAHRLCDRLLVYANGTNVQLGTKTEIMHQPATMEVAHITGCRNFLDVSVTGDAGKGYLARSQSLTLKVVNEPAIVQPQMVAGIHVHHLRLSMQPITAENSFPCQVRKVVAGTFSVTVMLDCLGHALQVEMADSEWRTLTTGHGGDYYIYFPPEKIFLVSLAAASCHL